jgi:hypothetical protein
LPNFFSPLLWAYLAVSVCAAIVCISKGRWGWFWLGFFVFGIFWIPGALQAPAPNSYWEKRRRRESPPQLGTID